MEPVYLTVISGTLGLLNTISILIVTAIWRKINTIEQSNHKLDIRVTALAAALKAKGVINGISQEQP